MSDKSKELNSSIRLVNDKLHFIASIGANEPVSIDYTPPLGDDLSYTSLELLLLSLSSCVGSSVHSLPGGLCTSWKRGEYTIDGCLHWLSGSAPGGVPTGAKTSRDILQLICRLDRKNFSVTIAN